MINVAPDLFELNVVSLFNLLRDFGDGERDLIAQQSFSVFDGKNDVIVSIIR